MSNDVTSIFGKSTSNFRVNDSLEMFGIAHQLLAAAEGEAAMQRGAED
jgi:hypothetical protein